MSRATERKRAGETLAGWSLMPISEAAKTMGVTAETAKKLDFPWIRIGRLWKADPLDVAIWVLAKKEGRTVQEFREAHGGEAAAHAGRYLKEIRKAQSEAA